MLSREVMGVFCLGVVWVTALLVAAAAFQDLLELHAIAQRARRAITGTIDGDGFAEWRVEQTARAIDATTPTIAFHDRAFHSAISGGKLHTADKTFEVAGGEGAVWTSEEERERAAACAGIGMFDELYAQARKAKGASRDVRIAMKNGDRVWIVGNVEGTSVVPEIVSTIDPLAFCNSRTWIIALFIPAELLVCTVATRIALTTPHFGTTSIIGALTCFAFFLLVTPLAVGLRERSRRPHRAYLRGYWLRPT